MFLQKCRDQRKGIFACFIDYEKDLDRVRHSRLISILRQTKLDEKDVQIVENLY